MYMKRFLSALLLIAICAPILRAADSEFNGWGIRASLDATMPGKWKLPGEKPVKMFSTGAGVSAGAVYNAPLGSNFYVEPGLKLFYDTYKWSDLVVLDDDTDGPIETEPTIKKFGARVPVMFGYQVYFPSDFSLSIFTGPEFSYCFSARAGYGKDIPELENMETNLFKTGMRRYDCGWKVGVGVPLGRWVVELDYYFGLVDQQKYAASYHERRLSLTVGYDF